MDMMKDLEQTFSDPPREFGPAPFWFLNEKLDKDELSWQIAEMKKKGLSGYVMHARYGLEVPYLSEEWFDKIGHILTESERQGMDAIIYDEVDWPSGMSGTRVLDDHPEYILTYLDISWQDCRKGGMIDVPLEEGNVVAIFGAQCREASCESFPYGAVVRGLQRLDSYAADGRFRMETTSGLDVIYFFVEKELRAFHPKTAFPQPKREESPFHQPQGWDWYFPYGKYVDLFNPDAVDYFFETTHEEYKRRFADRFGRTVTKVFTDEPGFYTVMRDGFSAVPWSRIYPAEFEKEYGYSIVDHLPALLSDIGERTSSVRHDFWQKLTSMFEKNYVARYARWCENNGLELIGHFRLCNPFLVWQMVYQGNAIPGMAQMHIPGVDALDNVEGELNRRWGIDEDVWQIESKLVSSVAHHYGKRRVMSESFALGGWKYKMENMKILSDWQYMMGINFMVPHAFHYSIAAQRKRECPPSQFYQNPMWENYNYFSRYLARLGTMMVDSKHVSDIALLYPMESLWAEYASGTEEHFPWDISDDFSYVTDRLLRMNLDYNILGQDSLATCSIEEGCLRVADQEYHVLIVPPMTTLRDESAKAIEHFVDAGGKVIFLSMIPFKTPDGSPLSDFVRLLEKVLDVSAQELVTTYRNRSDAVSVAGEKNVRLVRTGPLFLSDPRDTIGEIFDRMWDRDISIDVTEESPANVYASHWRKDGAEIYFLVNSDETPHSLKVGVRAIGEVSFWDPESGTRREAYCYYEEDRHLGVQCRLEALQTLFLVVDTTKRPSPRAVNTNTRVISADASSIELTRGDEKGPCFIDLFKGGQVKPVRVEAEPNKEILLPSNWAAKRYVPNVLVLNKWSVVQGFSEGVGWFNMLGGTVTWEATFEVNHFDGALRAVFDRVPEPHRIAVNGVQVSSERGSSYLDHAMSESDITELVRPGQNRMTIAYELAERAFQGKTGITPIEMMFDPVLIIGEFALAPANNEAGYTIDADTKRLTVGTWTDQGYPYYAGAIEYSQTVDVPEEHLRSSRCYLEANDVREIASLQINGATVGLRPWRPYTWDITDHLKAGKNEVRIVVWNTLGNLLDMKKIDSGLLDDVRIVSEKIVTVPLS